MAKIKLKKGMPLAFFAVVVAGGPLAQSATEKVLIAPLEKRSGRALNAFDVDPNQGPSKKNGLAELKWRESRGDTAICVRLATKLLPSSKDLEPWVMRTRLNCALQEMKKTKAGTAALLQIFLKSKTSYFRKGPWKDSLIEVWSNAGIEVARAQTGLARRTTIQALMKESDLLSREKRATLFALLGETFESTDVGQTLFLWKQAEDLQSTPGLAAKIQKIEEKQNSTAVTFSPVASPMTTETPEKSGESEGAEIDGGAEIEKLLAAQKRVEAAEKMIELMNRFPNGRGAKRDQDRLLQLLISASGKGDESEANQLRILMGEADSSRVQEWISSLHKRGEDRSVISLADPYLAKRSSSPAGAAVLWAAGRSAQFIGERVKAMRYFDQLIQFHGQADESAEAAFRLGLLQLREGLHGTAAKTFEKLINRNISKWDLGGRYWRIRGLEKVDTVKATEEREELLKRYPFTYYGLRLRGEANQGIVEFPKNDRSPLEAKTPVMWLVGEQQKAWTRFLRLSEEGWLLEAQLELSQIPTPKDPWSLLQWSKMLANWGQYPASILLSARALDQDESLRHPRYLDFAFPRAYSRFIDTEAKKNQVDPVLVRSLIRQESAFGLRAVSSSNALGLMQLIPPTAREVAQDLKLTVTVPDDLFRPEINVPMGSFYVAKMLKQFQWRVPIALAAYNAGPTRVSRWIKARPETQRLLEKKFESWEDEIWFDELPWSETSFYVKAILRNTLMDRLTSEGRVAVSPGFWSEFNTESPRNTPETAKRD